MREETIEYLNKMFIKACAEAQLSAAKFLKENYPEIDINYNCGKALIKAVRNGYLDVVKYLIENGADIKYVNSDTCWPNEKNTHVYEYLREKILNDSKSKYKKEYSHVLYAQLIDLCTYGYFEELKTLIKNNPEIDINYNDGIALRRAIVNGRDGVINFLLEKGADPYIALRYALKTDEKVVVKYFEDKLDIKITKSEKPEQFKMKCFHIDKESFYLSKNNRTERYDDYRKYWGHVVTNKGKRTERKYAIRFSIDGEYSNTLSAEDFRKIFAPMCEHIYEYKKEEELKEFTIDINEVKKNIKFLNRCQCDDLFKKLIYGSKLTEIYRCISDGDKEFHLVKK